MNRMLSRRCVAVLACWISLCLVTLSTFAAGRAASAPVAYPPNWWVGMRDQRLQLMIQAPGIGASEPRLEDTARARIRSVIRVDSPNYLFIDLQIAADAAPGDVQFRFERDGRTFALRYPLRSRRPGSAERRGFDGRDAILNLMPDRFANGDTHNDRVAGYAQAAVRSDPNGRHGGDLHGIRARLDYIAGMGYTMIWPTPLVENAQAEYSYHGYAATNLYRIDPRFGSNEDYRDFVAKARDKGLGVIQDVVLNHIGDEHPWAADPPTADWLTHKGRYEPTRHGRTAIADPYAAQSDRDDFTQGWFVQTMPDLNQRQPLLSTYLIQNAIWWIEYADLSGLRVDTYGYSDTAFLAEWTRRIRAEYPNFSMVGEEWSANPSVVARWQNGWVDGTPGMPNMMDFPLSETLRMALSEPERDYAGMYRMYEAMVNDRLYTAPTNLVAFEGNHDMPRLYSVLGENLDTYKLALTYLATVPRIPQFYYGSEVLMTSPTVRDDAAARRDFPGGWAGDRVNAFTGAGLTQKQIEAQTWLRTLLKWRKSATAAHNGRFLHYLPRDGIYVYFRDNDEQRLMIVLSRSDKTVELPLDRFAEGLNGAKSARNALTGTTLALDNTMTVPAHTALILDVCTPARVC